MARTIKITEREFDAMVSAMALFQAEYEGKGDFDARERRDIEAHNRVVQKWYSAGRGRS